jgi:hypothetical protein
MCSTHNTIAIVYILLLFTSSQSTLGGLEHLASKALEAVGRIWMFSTALAPRVVAAMHDQLNSDSFHSLAQ